MTGSNRLHITESAQSSVTDSDQFDQSFNNIHVHTYMDILYMHIRYT